MKARIFFMASFSRSGETLLLRHLNAHPDVTVPYNLDARETENSLQLFDQVKNSNISSFSDTECAQFKIKKPVVLLKQIWEHIHEFNGFILARNPASVISSILRQAQGEADLKRIVRNVRRWAGMVDESFAASIVDDMSRNNFIATIASVWSRRMQGLHATKLPIIYYENFVQSPAPSLRTACECIGVKYSEKLLQAHKAYKKDEMGHGGIRLSSKIHTNSLYSYQQELSKDEFELIKITTLSASRAFGYTLEWDKTTITPVNLSQTMSSDKSWKTLISQRLLSANSTQERITRLSSLIEMTRDDCKTHSDQLTKNTTQTTKSLKETINALEAQSLVAGRVDNTLQTLTSTVEEQSLVAGRVDNTLQTLTGTVEEQSLVAGRVDNTLQTLTSTVEEQNLAAGRVDNTLQTLTGTVEEQSLVAGRIDNTLQTLTSTVEEQNLAAGRVDNTLQTLTSTVEAQSLAAGRADSTLQTLTGTVEAQSLAAGRADSTLQALAGAVEAQSLTAGRTDSTLQALTGAVEAQSLTAGRADSTLQALTGAVETQNKAVGRLDSTLNALAATSETQNNTVTDVGKSLNTLAGIDKNHKNLVVKIDKSLHTLIDSNAQQKQSTDALAQSQKSSKGVLQALNKKIDKSLKNIRSVGEAVNRLRPLQDKIDFLHTEKELLALTQKQNIELLETISTIRSAQYAHLKNRFDHAKKTVFTLNPQKLHAHKDLEINQTHEGILLHSKSGDPQLLASTLWSTFFNFRYILKIVIDSKKQTLLELFYKTANDLTFSRDKKLQAPLIEGTNTLYLDLDIYQIREELRIDPGTCSGIFLLREFEIRRV